MAFINEEGELVVTWCLDDIKNRADEREIEISEEQAKQVLELMCRKHDCCIGINWDVMDVWTDYVIEITQ